MSNKYVDSGYVATGYIEGDTTVPLTPSDTRVVISRSVDLSGQDLTSNIVSLSVKRTLGLPYNTATLKLRDITISTFKIRNKDYPLTIRIGTDVYKMIIFDVDIGSKNITNIEARGFPSLLGSPLSTASVRNVAGTSNQVINELRGTILTSNNTPDFSFGGGSFSIDGTPLDGIQKILDVSGGEIFEADNVLRLEEKFRLPTIPNKKYIINDSILISKAYSDNTDGSDSVNKIVINRDAGQEVYSVPKITMAILKHGRPFFFFNPIPASKALINCNLGEFDFDDKIITYEEKLIFSEVALLDGGVKEILTCKLDGEDINYSITLGHNAVRFDTNITGVVQIKYKTRAISAYTINGYYDSTAKTRTYKVQYLNQMLDQSIDVPNTGTNNEDITINANGDVCKVIVDSNITKDQPFSFYVAGTLGKVIFSDGTSSDTTNAGTPFIPIRKIGDFDDTFLNDVTDLVSTIPMTMTVTVEEANYPNSVVVLPKGITPTGFKVGSIDIDVPFANNSGLSKKYYIDRAYAGASLTVAYTVEATKYTVPACGVNNTVKTFDIFACDGVTSGVYPAPNENDTNLVSCALPQTFTVNVKDLLGVNAVDAVGKVVTDSDGTSYTVDDFGKIYVTMNTSKKLTIDCSNVQSNREIYIDTSNVGG